MSILHVHVRYTRLLLWPATLSADYSFDCVPAVRALSDGRNLAAAALYLGLGWIGIAALRAGRASLQSPATTSWRAAGRAMAVLVLPMLPASHAFIGIGNASAWLAPLTGHELS